MPRVTVAAAAAATAVGSIRIISSPVLLPEQLERLEAQGARQRLQNELTTQLVAAGRFGEGGELQLILEIREFRLRTESGVLWVGAMAGPDLLGVTGRVVKNGVEVSTFDTGVSTSVGTTARYKYEAVRLDRMAVELSRRIIAKLPPGG